MKAESDISINEYLAGLSGTAGDLIVHDGTSWVRKTGASRGSLLVKGASTWEFLSPGAAGNFLASAGAGASPTYSVSSSSTGVPAVMLPPIAGANYKAMCGYGDTAHGSSSLTLTGQYLYAWPWHPPYAVDATNLYINVSGTVSSSSVKILVYQDSSGVPGSLILTSGTITTASSGLQSVAVSWSFTKDVRYWVALFCSNHTGAIVTACDNGGAPHVRTDSVPTAQNANGRGMMWMKTAGLSYGSPPNPFPAAPAASTTERVPLIYAYDP